MIRVCSGSNEATAGTNYLLGVATKPARVSIGLLEAPATSRAFPKDFWLIFGRTAVDSLP